jgi:hypothetical protein
MKKKKRKFKNINSSRAPVAHTCNPSYSGRRNREDHDSESSQANKEFTRPYLKKKKQKKKPSQKRSGGVA